MILYFCIQEALNVECDVLRVNPLFVKEKVQFIWSRPVIPSSKDVDDAARKLFILNFSYRILWNSHCVACFPRNATILAISFFFIIIFSACWVASLQQCWRFGDCSYFIPEDGDVESSPNVFLAPKPRQQGLPPTLGQIKEGFPLPGRYHFRFKTPLVPGSDREKDVLAVWMDCVQDNAAVPTWRGAVIAKVTRISMDDDDDEEDDDDDFHRSSAPPPAQNHHHNAGPPQPSAAASAAPPPAAPAGPVFDVFDNPTPSPVTPSLFDAPAANPASGSSLLDMDTPFHSTQRGVSGNSNGSNADFFGMNPTTPSPPSGGFPGVTPQVYQQPPQPAGQMRGAPSNAFDGFSQAQGPFGGLGTPWK